MKDRIYIIYDLESTCWLGGENRGQNEVIEIGAVKLGSNLEELDTFQCFVRPTENPTLSPFCMQLTNITQSNVDEGYPFELVMPRFEKWILSTGIDTILCSWGLYDKNQILREADRKGYKGAIQCLLEKHISLRHQLASIEGISRREANEFLRKKVGWEGDKHRALSDARNYSRFFRFYLDWEIP